MKIKTVSVQGFRSFATAQNLNLDALRPGLYHLAGKNEVEPSLEGNGAGKSSFLEAICWGLYGRTSRNIRAGSIKNWQSKDRCEVILEVETPAGVIGIYRAQNPNKLEVSINDGAAKIVDQKGLDALLGLPAESFLFSVYFAQFSPAFIDLRPADQMGAYSTVLRLNVWEDAAEAAGRRGRDLETAVQAHTQAVSGLQGQLKELRSLDFSTAEREWLENMERKDKELNKNLESKRAHLKVAESARNTIEKQTTKLKATKDKWTQAGRELAALQAESDGVDRDLAALTRKDLKLCPTCGAALKDNTHIKKEIADKKARSERLAGEIGKQTTSYREYEREWKKLEPTEVLLRNADRDHSTLQSEVRALEQMIEIHGDEVNPFDKQRADTDQRIRELTHNLSVSQGELAAAQGRQAAAEYWAKGFKELRLSLIEESLAQLSIESNAALVELGLKDWGLSFDVERETKKGSISKGFTVMVQAPHMRDLVQWECWSGGESQRLRVASTIGFSELIASRMGMAPNVEFFDEPSQWLSAAGIHDLLSSLADRAQRRGKVIIVADHRVLDFGGFAGSIQVVKTNKGSEIRL